MDRLQAFALWAYGAGGARPPHPVEETGMDRLQAFALWAWQPTPVFLPGESLGWGSLVACHLWAPGKAPNHIHTTLLWGRAPGKPSLAGACWASLFVVRVPKQNGTNMR